MVQLQYIHHLKREKALCGCRSKRSIIKQERSIFSKGSHYKAREAYLRN
jgi:hypothetical protein